MNLKKRKTNEIVSCVQYSSPKRRLFLAAFVLWGIFFPLVTYGAKGTSLGISPRFSKVKTSKPSKVSVKSTPLKNPTLKGAVSKRPLGKSTPLPVSAPTVKSVSSLPVVDTAAIKIVPNFFPALNKDTAALKGASATVVAAQGAVTAQKGVVQGDTTALQTAESQETALKRTVAVNTAAVTQAKATISTDTTELQGRLSPKHSKILPLCRQK